MANSGATDGDDDPTLSGDDRIIGRARARFRRCKEFYDSGYQRSLDDERFANQDDRNHYGWPDKIYGDRTNKRKPCLTINIVQPKNELVINESLENKAAVMVRGTGGAATAQAAEAYQMLIRRTENISSAVVHYRTTITKQVDAGFGYICLDTRFVSDKSFDQDVYIRAAQDPRGIYLDPDGIKRDPTGKSCDFGFEFETMSRDKFNREHPKFKDTIGQSTTLGEDPLWVGEKQVLVCMYYERANRNDELITYKLPDGSDFVGHRSEIEKDAGKPLVDEIIRQIDAGEIEGQYRDVITQAINWYLIGGDKIIKRGDQPKTRWIGKYIPMIPCWGVMTILQGEWDCKGHTRRQISPQQMLNYNASGQVQFGALQSRTPYVGPAAAFEMNEEQWANANTEDFAYLPYNDFVQDEGEEGRPVEAPKRQEPPQTAPVYAQGMQDAERWAMMVTGQWQDVQGQQNGQGPESGRAVNARQRQGNIATYHFTEHQYDMYRTLGEHLIDIYPKLYDTKRILHVEGEDLSAQVIHIDPEAQEAISRIKKETETAEQIILNPNVGEYEVVSDPGPNYATQRQQTEEAIRTLFAANKELAILCGDMYLANCDFPKALEMAERVKRELKATKPYLFDENADPVVLALQQQVQKLTTDSAVLMTKLADASLKIRGRDERNDIKAHQADTQRMEAIIRYITEVMMTPKQREEMEHELRVAAHQHVFGLIEETNRAELAQDAQPSGGGE